MSPQWMSLHRCHKLQALDLNGQILQCIISAWQYYHGPTLWFIVELYIIDNYEMLVKLNASHANDPISRAWTHVCSLKHMNKVIVTILPSILLGLNGDFKWI